MTQLMLAQTTRPVIYGLLAGVGFAIALATILIATPSGATISEIVHVTEYGEQQLNVRNPEPAGANLKTDWCRAGWSRRDGPVAPGPSRTSGKRQR